MWNFQGTFETRKRSFIHAFSICMTVPLIIKEKGSKLRTILNNNFFYFRFHSSQNERLKNCFHIMPSWKVLYYREQRLVKPPFLEVSPFLLYCTISLNFLSPLMGLFRASYSLYCLGINTDLKKFYDHKEDHSGRKCNGWIAILI